MSLDCRSLQARWGNEAALLAIALAVAAEWLPESWLGRNVNFLVTGLLALGLAYGALGNATEQTANDIDRIDRELDVARQHLARSKTALLTLSKSGN